MLIRTGMGGQLAGSAGGVTAGHNRFGQYLRNRSIPVNPNSPDQQNARGAFSAAITAWRSLSAATKQVWADYAANTPWVNKLGDVVYLTGNTMFLRYYCFCSLVGATVPPGTPQQYGQAPANIWPEPQYVPTTAPTSTFALTTHDTTFTGAQADALYIDWGEFFDGDEGDIQGLQLWGFLTADTVNFHAGPWKKLTSYSSGIGSSEEIIDLTTEFGIIQENQRMHLQLRYREALNGDVGTMYYRLSSLSRSFINAVTYVDP